MAHIWDSSAGKDLKNMTKPLLVLVGPTTDNGTVADRRRPPRHQRNAERRSREYLTDVEVTRLIEAAGKNRYGHRNGTMVLVAYRHGLRAGELVTLRWDVIDFAHGRLHVSRLKGSSESVHPLSGRELRALRRLRREQDPASPFIFTSERGAPFTPAGFRH
jgi:integrase